MTSRHLLSLSLLALLALCSIAPGKAFASTFTESGTFSTDDQILYYSFSTASTQTFDFTTTSYGGGTNLNGSVTSAGGFVPDLTLFSSSTGNVLGFAGASGMCSGSMKADAKTHMCDDASLSETLGKGSYLLALTEFPNVANGPNFSDGFLFASAGNFTSGLCGQSSGKFYQSDVAPCVQRDGNYTLNVNSASPVPEPPTWALVLPLAGVLFFAGRQHLA